MKIKNIINQRFGRLIVLSVGDRIGRAYKWNCRCDCGNIVMVYGKNLKKGFTKSCGCYKIENAGKQSITHGMTRTPEYRTWQHMMDRCYRITDKAYPDYGGRGIGVCDRWRESFENFFEDMGKRPSINHSIDRYPNNDGDYEPSNCRWGTDEQQARNRTDNHWIEYNGKKMILADWANELNVGHANMLRMLKKKTFEEVYLYYTVGNRRERKNTIVA